MEPESQPQPHARSELPVAVHGRLMLTDWVIGTVPDREAAEACAHPLLSAGFAGDDVLVESPAGALQQVQAAEERTQGDGLLARLFHTVEETATGAGAALRAAYVREARSDRWFVGAHDVEGTQTDRVRNLLTEHDGRCIHLFAPSGVRLLG